LADLVFGQAGSQPLVPDLRSRIQRTGSELGLRALTPLLASLERDPERARAFYIAVDAQPSGEWILHLSATEAPGEVALPHAAYLGRVRTRAGLDVAVTAAPFRSRDHENIRAFVERVSPAFLPRPQRALSAIAVGNRHPEISLPAAFNAFARILEKSGKNLASTVQLSATREMTTDEALAARDGEQPVAAGHTRVSIRHLYHAGLWAAVRAGWREGYTAEADHFIISGDSPDDIPRSVEATREAIRQAAGYTKFTTDTSRLFLLQADRRHPDPWSDAVVAEKFDQLFDDAERRWIHSEFERKFVIDGRSYGFLPEEVQRLAVKFGQSLKLNEELFDFIRQTKAAAPGGSAFDFEPSIDEAETLTTPEELIFYMHWLAARGRPAQLVPPNLGFKKRQAYPETLGDLRRYVHHKMWPELAPRVAAEFHERPLEELARRVTDLAAVAAYFDGTLSIHSGSGKQAEVLECIGRATAGRVNYKISGELQLQLFDVLAEQPAGSPWRALFERMVARANAFAQRGAFGAESDLATVDSRPYLGDASRGRVDGNLFLVFWLGNLIGSRDTESPHGDRRFFKEKLDELPSEFVAETRLRNARYIEWLAGHLGI